MNDLTGQLFNRWTVLRFSRIAARKTYFWCRCECGSKKEVRSDQLTRGVSKSCGCWKNEVAANQVRRLFTKHGQAHKTRTYSIWKGMRKRCVNSKDSAYRQYGGRGIKVCARWNDFRNFLADMGDCPDGHSIDRIDNNKGYKPDNCRWANKKTQANNTRANTILEHDGESLTISQWAEKVGLPYHTLYQRLNILHWPLERALKKS